MGSTYTQIIYQIIFSTKSHERTITESKRNDLFKYIAGIFKNKKCHLYRINGVEDHIHIITHIHPSVALANLVKDIKLASSEWIKKNKIFPYFNGWQDGYGAFTYSIKEKDRLIEYVKNQKEHHKRKTFKEEFVELLNEHEIEFDEKYLL
ncbi:MAG: IS200/IS605 family transposase [Bacteroidales bacterium]